MMQLTIAGADSRAPDPPDVSDPAATVWRDDADVVVALGQTKDGSHWVHLLHVGAFSFPAQAGDVKAIPDPGVGPDVVADAFRRMILPLALQAQGREVLHASAVRMPAGVIALCALSGTGKSTLACALSRRGHGLWADDAVCFEFAGDGVKVLPLPFTLRLRPASVAFFGGGEAEAELQRPEQTERLAAVFVLERSVNQEAACERLAAAAAFREVLTHGYCFSMHERARNEAMMRNYLELVARVPAFRVTFPEGLEHIENVLDLIETAVVE
jgi:hypothetical protein